LLEALAVSTSVVALGEIGDKTQLLALMLAARYRKPAPILCGIFIATVANHALAAWLGGWVRGVIDPQWLRWALGAAFVAVGLWMLVPDKADNAALQNTRAGWSVLAITTVAFFLAEMGDKTQIATVMLAARYDALLAVTAGTTLGMLLANAPVVLWGPKVMARVPVVWVHRIAAAVFVVLGVVVWAAMAPGP
jgi:Ca2+/H+ antiporter, TMEM165/GDT1 family